MSEDNNAVNASDGSLAKMESVLDSLPDNGKPKGLSIELGLETVCACGKNIHILTPDFFKFLDDGVVKFQNNVCPGCKDGEKADRELARFVCIKCKRAWYRIKPCKDSTGFVYSAGKSYHTDGCPYCAPPGKSQVKILEKVIHDRKLGGK